MSFEDRKSRLVVVSNRLPALQPSADWRRGKTPSAGGLVSALLPVMESTRQGLWMGWSGKSVSAGKSGTISRQGLDVVELVGMDLSDREVEAYYNGFCNRTLWPMFHLFQTRVRLSREEQEFYFRVNEKFSRMLLDLLEPGDIVWVHDYHMVPLGRYLRRGGFEGPIGFFLHIPFPPLEMIEILTDPLGFMDAWLDYDVVGFHTEQYVQNYFEVMEGLMLGVKEEDWLFAGNRTQKVVCCPIGIDPRIYEPERGNGPRRYRAKGLRALIPDLKIIIGVDRLDYTKGIPERLEAMEYFFNKYPEWRRRASLVQICAPSRTRVREYQEIKKIVDAETGRINGEYGHHDWTPIRYLYRTYGQADLARFYRDADTALITPLRDGMNLVAMEYVAAQYPESPGVPVLSRFTGVAKYLQEAVLVNPYYLDSVAEGLDRALSMSLQERKDRHQAMLEFIRNNTSLSWASLFIKLMLETHEQKAKRNS